MDWSEILNIDASDPGIKRLNEHSVQTNLPRKKMLIQQNARVDRVYLVQSGSLVVKYLSYDGTEVWLATLEQGAIIGEISALCSQLSSASVEASTEASLIAVPQTVFLDAMDSSGDFAIAVAKMLARRIADTSMNLSSHVALKIEDRLYNVLRGLAVEDAESNDLLVTNPPSVSDLAVRIHASREATSRAFAKLVKRGSLTKLGRDVFLTRSFRETGTT